MSVRGLDHTISFFSRLANVSPGLSLEPQTLSRTPATHPLTTSANHIHYNAIAKPHRGDASAKPQPLNRNGTPGGQATEH